MQVKKQHLETNKEQKTGSKLGKEYVKAACCHPAYLTYMQSTSCDTPGSMKHTLESRLPGEIPMTSDSQMTPNLWQKTKYLMWNARLDDAQAGIYIEGKNTNNKIIL